MVGAAIVRGRRVLAARRTSPAAAAGRWEFPGGKVEPGETPDDAIRREVAEELACTVRVIGWLAGVVPIGLTHELEVAVTELVDGDPVPGEHDAVRWLAPEELGDVDWLEPDRPFLPELGRVLAAIGGPREESSVVRGIFFEEDDARAAVRVLSGAGYEAEVVRERLAGEDDDEDHPWAVLSDAPEARLEMVVDEYDGWLDRGDEPATPPIVLPTAPKRVKRPDRLPD
ncbi:(deoxy)nucleoside triphosphate pyrophosphohydrolase [Nocardioides pacificus]